MGKCCLCIMVFGLLVTLTQQKLKNEDFNMLISFVVSQVMPQVYVLMKTFQSCTAVAALLLYMSERF